MPGLKKCDQEDCTVKKDGKCLEGIEDLTQCPHFYLDENIAGLDDDSAIEDNGQSPSTSLKPVITNTFKLFKGEEFKLNELTQVSYRYPVDKIFILGEQDSGKTTILATLFEMFQVGVFNKLHFAGSLTQIGFEKRCFYSRLASGNSDYDTERTKSDEFRFLHLALKHDPNSKKALHLLISDIAGEKVQRAKGNTNDMKDLEVITDSVHISYIIDGEKLLNARTVQSVLTQAKTFIRKAIDEQIFTKSIRLSIIVSKWDVLDEINFDFESLIVAPFTRDFNDNFMDLSFLQIAVRPRTFVKYKLGHGLSKLMDLWTVKAQDLPNPIVLEKSARMIDNLLF
ncbi:hypothetical protein HDC92_002851 [Pedobacter sp. AK017]|uniref:TRAFAC clade GTPase domain-containing protein n=1 Tax=Pedobacter sp. AK017 TaxID=2723073 RepID=UPI00160C5C69|nr:hypothetical protein [Pedobacter sp. AK017]MBB5439164.1 hypothetical protein [Pedobacter sp. AK017]